MSLFTSLPISNIWKISHKWGENDIRCIFIVNFYVTSTHSVKYQTTRFSLTTHLCYSHNFLRFIYVKIRLIQSLLKIRQREIKHCMAFSGGPSITEVTVFLASSVANNSLVWWGGGGILGVCAFNKVNNFQGSELVLKRKQDTCIAVRGLDVVIANSALGHIFQNMTMLQ